jgi:branched-chain amino acid transport system ATP-binding protein
VLSIEHVRVRYGGKVEALRSVSLDVPAGAAVAVLGANGAGKSTLLRAISGTLHHSGGRLEAGSIDFDGRRLDRCSAAEVVEAGVVQVPEGRRVFTRLTVDENLRVGGFSSRARAVKARAKQRVFDLFPKLHERRDQRAGLLSGGEQQMLAIGRALMASPRMLLLDEPSLGLAPMMVGRIGEVVTEINHQGTTVLLVEQNATMALQVASHAFVLTTGEVSLSGSAAELRANGAVRDLYLGRAVESVEASA